MNKGANVWVQNYKFRALGLKEPEDASDYFNAEEYFKEFMAPACYLVSGLSMDKFDWELASKCTFESQDYLASKLNTLNTPNVVINFFNSLKCGYAWMFILRDFCNVYIPAGNASELNQHLKDAWDKYMQDRSIRVAVLDSLGEDVNVIVDKQSNKPVGSFPVTYLMYEKDSGAKLGTSLLRDATNKPYYKLSGQELQLLKEADTIGLGVQDDAKFVDVPVVTDTGSIENIKVAWYTPNVSTPVEAVSLISALPKSLIDDCGDALHALIAYVNGGIEVSPAIAEFVNSIKSKLVEDYDVPSTRSIIPGNVAIGVPAQTLEEQGYVTTEYDKVTMDYCTEFGISTDCSIQQLLDFYNGPANELDPPTPVKVESVDYVDTLEKAGAHMLHSVRDAIVKDASIENRKTLTDCINVYFRIMMGDADNDLDEIVEALTRGANRAQPNGKRIIQEAIDIIKSG